MGAAVRIATIGCAAAAVLASVAAAQLKAPAPAVRPQRIMSMNQCQDMLVLQLVDKDRIVSASYLAKRGVRDIDARLAEGVATNFGSSEEILAQKPDLILAGDFSTAMTRDVARRAGSPMVQVKTATSFQDIRDITRQVGEAVGEQAKAQALVAQMDADLANLAARPAREPWRVVVWNGDSAPGGQTLAGAILRAAGAQGLEAREDSAVYASLGLEELLMAEPDFVLFIDDGGREPSLLSAAMQHRALKRRFGDRLIPYSEALFDCGVPQSAGAARALRDAFEAREP